MLYTLRFRSTPDFLMAHISAPSMTGDTGHAYVTEIRDKCLETGHNRLVILRDIPMTLSFTGFYHASEDNERLLHGIRTAWVNPYPQCEQALKFATIVANNRGAMFELFSRLDEAIHWVTRRPHLPVDLRRHISLVAPDIVRATL